MTRGALYQKHTGLADRIARDYFLPGADHDDVHQEARVGLWIATGTYNPKRGPFPPYAEFAVRSHLIDRVRAANREKHRVLTNAGRDEQLELQAPDTLRVVVARETLRDALDSRETLTLKERRRRTWRESKRRQRAAA